MKIAMDQSGVFRFSKGRLHGNQAMSMNALMCSGTLLAPDYQAMPMDNVELYGASLSGHST